MFPAFKFTSGVALETNSTHFGTVKEVTVEKQRSMNTRAVIAGFAKFFPSPPKIPFTKTIANTEPTIA